MSGLGGRIGGQTTPRVQLPAVTPNRKAWNKGRIIGQKRPLLPKQVWAIRARLELADNLRDLALFNVAIDSKLRGCDLVKLAVTDLMRDDRVRERVSVIQNKTKRPVQFELSENTRDTIAAWIKSPEMMGCRFMLPSRFHDRPHISTRQYGRLVQDWAGAERIRHPFAAPDQGSRNLSENGETQSGSIAAWTYKGRQYCLIPWRRI